MKRKPDRPRFDDGALAGSDFRDSGRRIPVHKHQQLCAQIQRCLELTLLGELHDPVFATIEDLQVIPGRDRSYLRVRITPSDPRHVAVLSQALAAARHLLIRAVSDTICRRRTPELHFELCN